MLKFGYGRATDHASEDIRLNKTSREKGKELVRQYDLQPLGKKYISQISDFLGYTESQLLTILEKFRNQDIWKNKNNGEWYIPGYLEE